MSLLKPVPFGVLPVAGALVLCRKPGQAAATSCASADHK